MYYIEMHAHMVSRTTDDYREMAMAGCVAVSEPAFWAGWDRASADGFEDYFRQLTEFEPKRAAQAFDQARDVAVSKSERGRGPEAGGRGSEAHTEVPGPAKRRRHW